ncbi:hypothetical protein HUN59_14780 [Curtobacterium sp. Csp2]|uniref:hypothetical protein n=1 Tax=Curtobacterium sp. Csp2 TaxID=2495430 RepID=UPI0015807BBD|nr:hypothetical protein [Curtobacterium sp. Csp2]QKS17305.1 hypothetical protein HUN59_14780 [Curtobacterium sp. Csp2]
MAAPRKTQAETSTTPMTDEEKARVAAAEQLPEPTPTPPTEVEKAGVEPTDTEQANAAADVIAHAGDDGTEEVTLEKDAGGHRAGDTITVTHGAAAYLREQGYVLDDED